MQSTIDSLSKIVSTGDETWELLRNTVNDPLSVKTARKFTTQDVSALIGRAPASIRAAEKRGAIPMAERDDRGRRIYTIDQIDEIRKGLNIQVGRRQGDECCILGVITYKGGAGKTTSATSLGQYLTLHGYRVLLIDCDPQASCTSFFNYIPDRDIDLEDTIYRVMVPAKRNGIEQYLDPADMRELVRDTHWGNLKLVPACLEMYDSEMYFSQQVESDGPEAVVRRLASAIDVVSDEYDVIVMDAPPSLGAISMNVVMAVDGIISPIQPSVIDFASNQQFLRMIIDLMERFERQDLSFYRLLINNYMRHPASDNVVNMLRTVYAGCCMSAAMGRTQEVNNAGMLLKTVYELASPIGDNKTYRRALRMMDIVNQEIEILIKKTWPSYAKEMAEAGS